MRLCLITDNGITLWDIIEPRSTMEEIRGLVQS